MRAVTQASVFSPTILVLALLAAIVVFVGVSGKKVPLLSNVRADVLLLVVLGMAICAQGGIGRVAAAGMWTHPLAILGYVLGGLILLVTLAVFVGWKLPWIHNDQQALIAIAVLAVLKIVNALVHAWLART
jgi:hypothetical protein